MNQKKFVSQMIRVLIIYSIFGLVLLTNTNAETQNVALENNDAYVIGGAPINDGVVTGYTGSTGYSWVLIPGSITIVLPKTYNIEKIKTLLWDGDTRYYQYYIEVSEDGQKWTKVVDKTSGQWKSWQLDSFDPILAKYIRITGTYDSANNQFHIVELEAYASSEPIKTPIIENPVSTPKPTNGNVQSASVNLHGEKTDVVLGENVLLKLSAINIIGNPIMHVQVIIIPPNGWSVTSSEFSKSGAGQYTTMYDLKPEDGSRDIEVRIMPNQIGDNFEVKGRIIYYFGDDLSTREDHPLSLPIKVRAESKETQNPTVQPSKSPGFEIILVSVGMILAFAFRRK